MSSVKAWAVDTGLRAVKTGAQTAVALLGANAAELTNVHWTHVLDVAGLAVIVSVLHNLSNLNAVNAAKWYYEGGSVQPAPSAQSDLGPVI